MRKYGTTATTAARLIATGVIPDPRTAWQHAVNQEFPDRQASQRKSCPHDSFLGLCEAGQVVGVRAGQYTQSVRNKDYVMRGLAALRSRAELASSRTELWRIASRDENKCHNGQMDVLVALWSAGLIKS